MPRPRIGTLPMTSAPTLGATPGPARARAPAISAAGAAPPATAATVGGGGCDADRFAGRILRLARQPAGLHR